MNILDEDGQQLSALSEDLKNDRDVVMAAVQNNGASLEYTHQSLKMRKK